MYGFKKLLIGQSWATASLVAGRKWDLKIIALLLRKSILVDRFQCLRHLSNSLDPSISITQTVGLIWQVSL